MPHACIVDCVFLTWMIRPCHRSQTHENYLFHFLQISLFLYKNWIYLFSSVEHKTSCKKILFIFSPGLLISIMTQLIAKLFYVWVAWSPFLFFMVRWSSQIIDLIFNSERNLLDIGPSLRFILRKCGKFWNVWAKVINKSFHLILATSTSTSVRLVSHWWDSDHVDQHLAQMINLTAHFVIAGFTCNERGWR